MKLLEIINEAACSWYEETGIRAVRLLMHPRNYADLLNEADSARLGMNNLPWQLGSMSGPQKMTVSTPVSPVEVLVAAQEVVDEFVLVDEKNNMKRFTILEGGNIRSVLDAPKVLIVKRSKLFLKRDPKNKYFQNVDASWSERLLQEVSQAYDLVVVFHDVHTYHQGAGIWPDQTLQDKIKDLKLQNVGVAAYNSHQQLEAIQIWKERILEVGGRIKRVPNVRDINCFNIPGLTVGDHITWVDEGGDYDKGIIVEKAKSFLDLAKDRESRSKW